MKYYNTAQEAFEDIYRKLRDDAYSIHRKNETRCMYNVSFTILKPEDNHILTPWRKWSLKYARREFNWYLSGNPSVADIKRFAPIWDRMHGGNDLVNSNYGYQWKRNKQLEKVVDMLRKDPETRKAFISLYDGKEIDNYEHDTPCTIGVGFYITGESLNMTVLMRSNDIFYGFCNDQYCFSELQKIVAQQLGLSVGVYHHHATDMHLYYDKYNAHVD